MEIIHRVARPLLAGMFVYGGFDAFRNPEGKAGKADFLTAPASDALEIPDDPVRWVRANGAVQAGAGTALALGRFPRFAALLLAGSLIPTTIAGHRFWEEREAASRANQRIQFLKNLSMLGGLLLATVDTDVVRQHRHRRAA